MTIRERIKNFYNTLKTKIQNSFSLNSTEFLQALGIGRKHRPTSEATYFICLKMLSETLAKMPLKMYQETEKGVIKLPYSDETKVLTTRPNPLMTPTVFWNTVEINRNHYGNGYVFLRKQFIKKKYGGEIKLLDAWVMQSNCVQIIVDDAGWFMNKGRIWYVYNDPQTGKKYVLNSDDVIHVKTSHTFNGIVGLPVQQILKETVNGAAASQEFMNKMYESGLTAKAVLEYSGELNKETKEKLVKSFEEFGSGAKNTGKIIPVPHGMRLVPLDIKLTDAQFFELKKYNALQIAAAFGVKPNHINNYEKSSYSNSEMQQLSFYIDTELFVIKQYEEEINYKALSEKQHEEGKYYKFNEKVLLRTDSKTQMQIFTEGIKNSIYMPNEVRRKYDMQDADGGDRLYANGNIIPLDMAGAQYIKDSVMEGGE